jgi:hypothetical protein
VLEHLLPVARVMLGVEHRQLDIVFAKKIEQQLLALDLWQLAEVSVAPKKVEGIVNEPPLSTRSQLCLKLREVSPTFMDNYYLAVDDGFALDGQRTSNLGKAFGPVQSSSGVDFLSSAVEMHLNAVAVVLDLMEPQVNLGALALRVASWGLMNPSISIRFDTQELTKRPAAPWATASILLTYLEHVVVPATTTAGRLLG